MALPDFSNAVGLVLAGGLSGRFGREKALAELCGHTLLSRAVETLKPVVANICVSARQASETESSACAMGVPAVYDRGDVPGGPLAGILVGLEWAGALGAEWLLSLPCDTVFVPQGAFECLLAKAQEAHGAYAVTSKGMESLVAAWPVAGVAAVKSALAEGAHPPVSEMLRTLGALPLFFAGADIFLNINTQEDLAAAERIASGGSAP